MGISIGLVGLGDFGSQFADLFRSHPLVSRVGLCDREPERIARFARRDDWKPKFNPRDAYHSLDDILKSDLDAVAIFTQHWLHTPQAVAALNAGKHVYSAVPLLSVPDDDEILHWCDKLVRTCQTTGQLYMYGETTYYHSQSMFCRRKAREGAFGDFVYAEGEYFHDLDSACSLREVYKHRSASAAGQEWVARQQDYLRRGKYNSPMHYPTHSTCGPVCVMNARATKVTACGYRNRNNDPFFANSAFSNVTALYEMNNGAAVRICEFREVAGSIADSETFRILGTAGSFCENRWMENGRTSPLTAKKLASQALTPEQMRDPLPPEVHAAFAATRPDNRIYGAHGGSHPYLVHEFVSAVSEGRLPAITAWDAVRYTAMGVAANQSALRGGERIDVPDWGNPPR